MLSAVMSLRVPYICGGISCLAGELWAPNEGLRPMEKVCQLMLAVKVKQGARGGAVGRGTTPKPEGRGFDSRWCR